MTIKKSIIILMSVYICYCLKDGDDLHSSVTALHDIFNAEKLLIENLEYYIKESEQSVKSFKRLLNNFGQPRQNSSNHQNDQSDVRSFLNFFVKRRKLSKNITDFLYNRKIAAAESTKNFTRVTTENDIPSERDLDGATLGILRVQEIYGIPAADIADGIIKGIDFKTKFTAFDCMLMAFKLREFNFHHYAIEWSEIALKRIEKEGWKGIIPEEDKTAIIDFLLNTKYEEGSIKNVKDAIEISLQIVKENFNHRTTLHFVKNLEIFVQKYINLKSRNEKSTSLNPPIGTIFQGNLVEYNLLKKGCRGEFKKSPAEQRKLFCRYEKQNHPFLRLAPIKTEVLNLRPYLTVSYDVLYDSEIEILKNLSKEELTRAGVWNQDKGVGVASTSRTSKFAWFGNETHPIMHILNQRVSDITGLSMETSEHFQLMNYGIGGHYDVHPDYFPEPEDVNGAKPYGFFKWGNRIATVLFYMSDVAEGGGTTWPNIKVTTPAKKGSAAFWYNLYADGKPDYLARHSACPIILGSKWVINKWIRIRGQEFRRPCLTYRDHLDGARI